MARPWLEARLDETFGRRLTLVVAGAGYGKSTLVAQWAEELVAIWYTPSAADGRLTSVAGIVDALRPHLQDVPTELVGALASGAEDLHGAELVAAHLSDALEASLAHDLVLVVDDADELATSPTSLRMVESLCRQAPPELHLVLVSREALALRVDRLRAQGQVLELSSADLAFTAEEVEALCRESLDQDGRLAGELHRATGGWPAAVRLAIEALVPLPPDERERAVARVSRPGGALFSFLAHEVFERQSEDVRAFIRTVTPLESFSIELCEELGVPRAAEVVQELARRGFFVRALGEEFTLHALVREFARSAWPLTSDETRAILVRAAAWLESEGRLPEAFAALAAAADHDETVRLLEARGAALLSSGDGHVVSRIAADLPSEARTAAVDQLLGEALLMQGELDAAMAALQRAAGDAQEIDAALAWRIGMAHHFRGQLGKAIELYTQAADRGADADRARLLAWAAGANAVLTEDARALSLASQALELATACGDDRALAAAHSAIGVVRSRQSRYPESEHHLNAALAAAERARDLIILSRIRTNRAATLTARGFYRRALAELDEAMRIAELPGFTSYGRTLTNRANTRLRLGLLDEAGADFALILEFSRPQGGAEAGLGHIGIADVHRERGNLALARTGYELGLELLTESERSAGEPLALEGLARVLVDDAPGSARQAAQRAIAVDPWFPAAAWCTAGWVALAHGDPEYAAFAAAEAQRHAQAMQDRYGLAEALALAGLSGEHADFGRGLLEEALSIWRELESRVRVAECELALAGLSSGAEAQAAADRAERKLRALGVRVSASGPAGLLRTVARRIPAPAAVQVLGGFAVLRDGEPVPLSEWKTRKPRELLKILVCRRGRPVPRDLVMEALWPDEDPGKLANRLSVALSTLRTVLDPERRFDAEHFVRSDRESIALDLKHVVVDAEVFLHEAGTGLSLRAGGNVGEAADWLVQAEAAYAGDVLEEDPYSEWALSLREEARATYISLAHALARDAVAAGRDDDALRYFLRVLARDAYDEGAHLGAVATLERSGRRGEARRAYRAYVARTGEIGATPAAFPAVLARGA